MAPQGRLLDKTDVATRVERGWVNTKQMHIRIQMARAAMQQWRRKSS